MSSPPCLCLNSGDLSVRIALRGAELKSLQHAGREFIWQADPLWWPFSAPLLFPVVGRLNHGQITHEGKVLHLPPHGFARDLAFTVLQAAPDRAELSLRATALTPAMYPFDFELHVCFELGDKRLIQRVRIFNHGANPMPAAFGFHPGFCWPVRQAGRMSHSIRFTHPESAAVFCVDKGGRLARRSQPLKLQDNSLALDDELFADGALVLDPLCSTGLEYYGPEGPLLRLTWTGCRQLGLWSLPGAPFVCFEPWHGYPSPAEFSGSLADKPGNFLLGPGQSKSFGLTISV